MINIYYINLAWYDGIINKNDGGFKYKELTYTIKKKKFKNLISNILGEKTHEEKVCDIKQLFFQNIPNYNNIPDNLFDFLKDKKFMLLYMYLEKY